MSAADANRPALVQYLTAVFWVVGLYALGWGLLGYPLSTPSSAEEVVTKTVGTIGAWLVFSVCMVGLGVVSRK